LLDEPDVRSGFNVGALEVPGKVFWPLAASTELVKASRLAELPTGAVVPMWLNKSSGPPLGRRKSVTPASNRSITLALLEFVILRTLESIFAPVAVPGALEVAPTVSTRTPAPEALPLHDVPDGAVHTGTRGPPLKLISVRVLALAPDAAISAAQTNAVMPTVARWIMIAP